MDLDFLSTESKEQIWLVRTLVQVRRLLDYIDHYRYEGSRAIIGEDGDRFSKIRYLAHDPLGDRKIQCK